MTFWQRHIKKMPAPSVGVVVLDMFFIMLIVFMLSSNFVFYPGIKSISLPVSEDDDIIAANKLVITVTKDPLNSETGGAYIYSFNGQVKNKFEELEATIAETLNGSGNVGTSSGKVSDDARKIVLRAEKSIPYEEIIHFYMMARKHNVQLFLVTDTTKRKTASQIDAQEK